MDPINPKKKPVAFFALLVTLSFSSVDGAT
jgi:hypothetical protein